MYKTIFFLKSNNKKLGVVFYTDGECTWVWAQTLEWAAQAWVQALTRFLNSGFKRIGVLLYTVYIDTS